MKSNTRFNQNKRGIECLNCHQPIAANDNFCSDCGQVNDLKPLSIKQYISEFFSGFFAFDTRTLNTIIPLIFKPGKVTNEYIQGERMKFVNPFQLYLHTSIIFFLVTSVFETIQNYREIQTETYKTTEKKILKNETVTNLSDKDTINPFLTANNLFQSDKQKDSLKFLKKKKELTDKQLMVLVSNNLDSVFFNESFKRVLTSQVSKKHKDSLVRIAYRKNIKFFKKLIDSVASKPTFKDDYTFKKEYIKQFETKLKVNNIDFQLEKVLKLNPNINIVKSIFGDEFAIKVHEFNSVKKNNNIGRAIDSLGYPITRTNIFLFKKSHELEQFNESGYFGNAIINKTPIVIFFMLPVFAFFLMVFFPSTKMTYTEHLIFVFHTQTVFFLMLLVGLLIDIIFKTNLVWIIILLFLIYLIIALKKVYKQKWMRTILKFISLNIMYLLVSILGLIVVVLLAIIF